MLGPVGVRGADGGYQLPGKEQSQKGSCQNAMSVIMGSPLLAHTEVCKDFVHHRIGDLTAVQF